MKNLTIISTLFIFFSCSNPKFEKKSNDLEKSNLKGSVKILEESIFNVSDKFGKIIKGKLKTNYNKEPYWKAKTITSFNKQGNIICEKTYYSSGLKSSEQHNEYDENNLLIKQMFTAYLNYEYPISKDLSYTLYIMNKDASISKIYPLFYEKDSLSCKIEYDYDDKNLVLAKSFFNTKNQISFKKIFEYFADGNLKSESSYDDKGKLESKVIWSAQGNIENSLTLSKKEKNYLTIKDNVWDGMSKAGNNIHFNRGDYFSKTEFDDEFSRYVFKKDKNGNWIKKTHYNKKTDNDKVIYEEPSTIVERKITYY